MDKLDLKILNILQRNSNIPVKEIAAQIGLSYSPTYERIRVLEDTGVIKSRVVILDPKKVGIKLFVYCNITLKEQSIQFLKDFEKSVMQIPEIMEVSSLSGSYDYMIKVATTDIETYNDFVITKIASIPNIGQYHSNIVMSMVKDETAYFIEEE
ncbi:Lrp/AsnC family transcriptional regulator [Flavobacterium tegetincola]|uniref:Lrp/AsnC family transcriptional regulator n=1 Tax=Flavobacterium tegetincola TaxID=150172 RepID=UPI000407823C|nr:Lrp/AsnC family transcriptional regulator [Flavobacterium tegetincola]